MLKVKDLRTYFNTDEGVVHAVNCIGFEVEKGDFVGIVGESGSGKTVTALSILRLVPSPPAVISGEIIFEKENLLKKSEEEMQCIRGAKISMIFQDPMTALNPTFTIGEQVAEVLKIHKKKRAKDAREIAVQLLEKVRIPDARQRFSDYPHQLSGGMRQRVMIAMAIVCEPSLIIADEPTTALDVTVQAEIINLLCELQKNTSSSIILITHNLGIVAESCRKILIMYAGKIVEKGLTKDIFYNSKHPYTLGLLKSVPRLDEKKAERLFSIPGQPPDLTLFSRGCEFYPRCSFVKNICKEVSPEWKKVSGSHFVRCHH